MSTSSRSHPRQSAGARAGENGMHTVVCARPALGFCVNVSSAVVKMHANLRRDFGRNTRGVSHGVAHPKAPSLKPQQQQQQQERQSKQSPVAPKQMADGSPIVVPTEPNSMPEIIESPAADRVTSLPEAHAKRSMSKGQEGEAVHAHNAAGCETFARHCT